MSTIESVGPDGRKRVLSARGVTKVYRMGEVDVHALRGVDWDLHEGEMTVLVGASGDRRARFMARRSGADALLDARDLAAVVRTARELAPDAEEVEPFAPRKPREAIA